MGRLLPPVDIQNEAQLSELNKRISLGPITLVLVYADWCGHCQRFKPMMEKLENMPGRSIQTARIREDVFPKSNISSAKIEGYPTLMLVKKNGEVASFKNEAGEVTNAIPDHTNMTKMATIVRNVGKNEGVEVLEEATNNKSKKNSVISINTPSIQEMSNKAASPYEAVPNIPENIVADRMSPKTVETLNNNLVNASNSLLTNSTKAVQGNKQTGGSLYSQLAMASKDLLVPAALFLGAEGMRRRRRTKKVKKASRRRRSRSRRS